MEEIKNELGEQELENVTGGAGLRSGYDYVTMFLKEDVLRVYAGYDVRAITVTCNGSLIRKTSSIAAGNTIEIVLLGGVPTSPTEFKVTGWGSRDGVSFEYTLTV